MLIKTLLKNLQYKIIIFINSSYTKYRYGNKINKILDGLPNKKLTKDQKKEICVFYDSCGYNLRNLKWHEFFTNCNGIFHNHYIPEDLFFSKIEPALNRIHMVAALSDKNMMDILIKDVKQPKTILKNINGFFYVNENITLKEEAIDLCLTIREFVIKPTIDSRGGRNVVLFNFKKEQKLNKSNKELIKELFEKYSKDYIIQEVVTQHDDLSLLNSSSVNTIRVFSYLRKTEAHILSTTIRVGNNGDFTDNVAAGGGSWGIDKFGIVKPVGYDNKYNKIESTSSGLRMAGIKIPQFKELIADAKKSHLNMPNFRLISWDFTVNNDNEVILVEFNTIWQEINAHQLMNGPVFGKFTEEILRMSLD